MTEQGSGPSREVVLAVVGFRKAPLTISDIGLEVAKRQGLELPGTPVPVGQLLAEAGLSLSALQKVVDALVNEELVVELRGRDLHLNGLPTVGTKAQRRYFLSPRTVEAARSKLEQGRRR
jgi:hypothetical protein